MSSGFVWRMGSYVEEGGVVLASPFCESCLLIGQSEERDQQQLRAEHNLAVQEETARTFQATIEDFLVAMAGAGNPGTTMYWRGDPVRLTHFKRRTRATWRAWIVGEESFTSTSQDYSEGGSPTNNGRPYTVTGKRSIGLTPEHTWLTLTGVYKNRPLAIETEEIRTVDGVRVNNFAAAVIAANLRELAAVHKALL